MNIPDNILAKLDRNLHLREGHPIEIIKWLLWNQFAPSYDRIDTEDHWVSIHDNFDSLLVPADHPSRALTDTYYRNADTVLRTHTTAHMNKWLSSGRHRILVCGDVYRKDTIDATHYPVFTQMDGHCVLPDDADVTADLKATLGGLIETLFPGAAYRFKEDYFPFTVDSIEAEVEWQGQWLEILGGGTIHPTIMENCGLPGKQAWAFGLGLDRLAMILFEIPDIRLLWSTDPRFTDQFTPGEVTKFKPYSKHPPVHKDISMWLPKDWSYNVLCEIIRSEASDLVETVALIDEYKAPNGTSHCYRVTYRSMERSLTDIEINDIQARVRERVVAELGVVVR